MRRTNLCFVFLIALFVAACGGDGSGTSGGSGGSCGYTVCASLSGHTYVVYEPATLAANAPMLVLLHGANVDRDTTEALWRGRAFADLHGYRLVIPQGSGNVWNYDSDVGFLSALIDTVQRERGASAAVFIAGWSNGSVLSQVFACDHADQISGVISLAGPLMRGRACKPSRPVGIALMGGTNDSIVPVTSGAFGSMGMAEAFGVWKSLMQCGADNLVTTDTALMSGGGSLTTTASGCLAPVQQTLMGGAGHNPGWNHTALHERMQDFFQRSAAR